MTNFTKTKTYKDNGQSLDPIWLKSDPLIYTRCSDVLERIKESDFNQIELRPTMASNSPPPPPFAQTHLSQCDYVDNDVRFSSDSWNWNSWMNSAVYIQYMG